MSEAQAGPAPAPPPVRTRRSIFVQLVLNAVLFALVTLSLLFAVTVSETRRTSEGALAVSVETDMAALVDVFVSGGERDLVDRVRDRSGLTGPEGRQARYLLSRPGGSILAGNIGSWPDLDPQSAQTGYVTLDDGTRAYARALRLADDLDLLVARSSESDRVAMIRLAFIFLATAANIILAGWLLGRRAAENMRERVEVISDALRAAEEGRETGVTSHQPSDEIGELADLSGRTITRAASLARTHRHMSDQIAHEIRTPLTRLDRRLATAIAELPPDADYDALERSRQDIRSVVAMLDSLLDIAASEGRVGDRSGLEEIDLSALAADLGELYEGSAEEAGIELRQDIVPGVAIMGERMQFVRLISNLLDNALKHVPEGGRIELVVREGPVVEVRDDGPGIDPDLRPLVFDRFRTGAISQDGVSHGLGLALAQAIALRHEMKIGLVDAEKGAHFVVKPHKLWETGGLA